MKPPRRFVRSPASETRVRSCDYGLLRKDFPLVGIKPGHAERLTCRVKELAGVSWHSEQFSCSSGVSGSLEGAGTGAAGWGSDEAESSFCLHSFIFTTKSQHV